MSQRQDWEIVLYGSDAATAGERRAEVSGANSRMSGQSQNTVTGHGMNEYGYQRGIDPNWRPPQTPSAPSNSAPNPAPKVPDKKGIDNRDRSIDGKDMLLMSLLANRGKQRPSAPKIEIKNPALPAPQKDNSIIVAIIGAVALYMANQK